MSNFRSMIVYACYNHVNRCIHCMVVGDKRQQGRSEVFQARHLCSHPRKLGRREAKTMRRCRHGQQNISHRKSGEVLISLLNCAIVLMCTRIP